MRINRIVFGLMVSVSLLGCGENDDNSVLPQSSDIGITYREGKGLEVSEETKKAIQLQTIEVEEGTFVPRLVKTGTVIKNTGVVLVSAGAESKDSTLRVAVSLTPDEAKSIRIGQEVLLSGLSNKGIVTLISDPDPLFRGEREAIVEFKSTSSSIDINQSDLIFDLPRHEASAMVPKSALLTTSTGLFVYVPNGKYFFRTAVAVGKKNDATVEIVDGLYSGDEVVSSAVMTLWLAELQAIKGGVSCADGH